MTFVPNDNEMRRLKMDLLGMIVEDLQVGLEAEGVTFTEDFGRDDVREFRSAHQMGTVIDIRRPIEDEIQDGKVRIATENISKEIRRKVNQ